MKTLSKWSWLPIGSVVTLKGYPHKVMIYGRLPIRKYQDKIDDTFDYVGCNYPIGHISSAYNVFFCKSEIEEILFIGYKDSEEMELVISLG